MPSTYDIGDLIQLKATFTDTGGNAVTPSGVRFLVNDPTTSAATVVYTTGTTPAVTNPSTNVFQVQFTISATGGPGTWHYRVDTDTGTGQAADESWFRVQTQKVST